MSPVRVWRICHEDYIEEAFTGEGARIYGGRFNSEGHPVVYASGSLSLALLEILVQTNDRNYFSSCVQFYVDIPDHMITGLISGGLPAGWNSVPYGTISQDLGDDWLEGLTSVALKVPSVIVPAECNYLINPVHPDFGKIHCSEPAKPALDERLLKGD